MRRIREPTASADYRRKKRKQMVSNKQSKSEKEIKVMAKEFKSDIKAELGQVGKYKVQVISFNDRDAKIGLHEYYEKDGEERMGKGINLTNDEAKALVDILTSYLEEDNEEDF